MDRHSPYRSSNTLRSLQSEVNRLFEDIFPGREAEGDRSDGSRQWAPQVDVMETGGAYRLRVDLPGVSREEVTINAENNQVTIQGERGVAQQQNEVQQQSEAQKQGETMLRTERAHGRFYRSLTLPTDINPDKAKAQFQDGVLLIDLPKVGKSKAKAISIS